VVVLFKLFAKMEKITMEDLKGSLNLNAWQ
jgi:hypothetical protein